MCFFCGFVNKLRKAEPDSFIFAFKCKLCHRVN